jgi:hypothetical protein
VWIEQWWTEQWWTEQWWTEQWWLGGQNVEHERTEDDNDDNCWKIRWGVWVLRTNASTSRSADGC